MKISHKTKQLEDCIYNLNIEVPKEEIVIAYQEVYKQIQKEVTVPGFRKGNAPRDLIEANYKDFAREKVLESLVEDSYKEAMRESGLSPVGLPKIENLKFSECENLSFEAVIETRPKIALKNYKGLNIKKKSIEVKPADIDAALENLRQLGAHYKVQEPRPVKEGDFVLCNLEWFVENNSVDKKEFVLLPVEKKTLTQDVFNGILGSGVGEKKSISINIDKDFHKPEYIGKSGTLDVFIHQIKEKELPLLNDAFAKDLGVAEGLESLKEKISQRLAQEKQQASYLDMQDQIISQLLKAHSFKLPKSLVETELKNLIENSRQRLLEQGYSEKDAAAIMDKEKDAMIKKLRPHAEEEVGAFFILEEIADKENLVATHEQLDSLIATLAQRNNQSPETFRKQLQNDDRLTGLHWQLTEARVMEFLIDNAKVQEEKEA